MTDYQSLIMAAALIAGTVTTRFLPFIIFLPNKKTPEYVLFLGRVLPYSMMGLLIVFCLKEVSITASPHGLPEILAMLCILGLHHWRKNVLLSIGGGTLIYMLLVQNVFI